MILVNNPGDWAHVFWPLLHAEWNGWTPTDLVFPFFLFIVGVAIPFALGRRLEAAAGDLGPVHRKILGRAAILFGLGLALNWFPYFGRDWSHARIPGVLQRIAVVYLVAALAYLHLRVRGRIVLTVALLGGYWGVMKLVPAPGFSAGDLSVQGNLAAWLDHLVLGTHTWSGAPGPGDPEGLLSTLPAIASALAGIFTGEWMRRQQPAGRRLAGLLAVGVAATAAGLALAPLFPINKNLWTPTYVIFTSGAALLVLAACHWAIDLRGRSGWAWPFLVYGTNAILVFVGTGLQGRLFALIKLDDASGATVSLQHWLYHRFYTPWLPDVWASLAWAVSYVLLWLVILAVLDRKGIHLKV